MIGSLTGPNAFELQNALRTIKQSFVTTYGDVSVEVIDATDYDVGRLLDVVSALPFLSSKRLVVIQNIAANKPATEKVNELIAAVSDATDLYFVEPKLDKRSVLYKTLKKETDFKEFTQIDVQTAPQWLVQQASDRGGTLGIADARYMVQRMGVDQLALSNQLDVLLLYDAHIRRDAIDVLTEKTPQSSIFDLIEAAFSGKTKLALELYQDQRAQNVEPLAVEALFVWQLHILLLVKAAGQAKKPLNELGISPYVVQKSASLVSHRTMHQLKTYIESLTRAEYQLKTTSVVPDEVMKNFIVMLGQ